MKGLIYALGLAGLLMFTDCKKVFNPEEPVNISPVAYFKQTAYTIYLGERIEFDASSSYDRDGIITDYEWDFNDGTLGFGKIIKYEYKNIGRFHPSLTITDNKGAKTKCYNSSGKSVTVLKR